MAANRFSSNGYDGIFASTMVRTQETAQAMATKLGEKVEVLPGLREIEAGQLEGQPEATAGPIFYGTLTDWVTGHRGERIPGSVDGNEFEARFNEAVKYQRSCNSPGMRGCPSCNSPPSVT
jgi:broad specificity phosphatase PhoE